MDYLKYLQKGMDPDKEGDLSDKSEITTLLADDHAIVMEGIKELLKFDERIKIMGTLANGQEVLDFVREQPVDVVILDINMPIMDGITCAKHLKREFPAIKVIVLTMYAQKSFIEEIISIGIDGCLLKSNTAAELLDAISRVITGRQYYDRISSFISDRDEVVQYRLSDREKQIIHHMAHGLTSTDIADKLCISEHTVKTHRKNILRKLDLRNSSQVVQYAVNNQLI